MKTNWKHIASFMLFITILAIAFAVQAQDTNAIPTSGNAAVDASASIVAGVVSALTGKYGWLLTVLAWIGVLRAAMKPIMLVVEAIVKATPGTNDDEAIAKFESGPIYKWLVWGLDWIASIKVTNNTNPLTK